LRSQRISSASADNEASLSGLVFAFLGWCSPKRLRICAAQISPRIAHAAYIFLIRRETCGFPPDCGRPCVFFATERRAENSKRTSTRTDTRRPFEGTGVGSWLCPSPIHAEDKRPRHISEQVGYVSSNQLTGKFSTPQPTQKTLPVLCAYIQRLTPWWRKRSDYNLHLSRHFQLENFVFEAP